MLATENSVLVSNMGGDIPLPPHNWVNVCLILASAVIFVITAAGNALAGKVSGLPSVGDISDKYQVFIVPAGMGCVTLIMGVYY